MDKKKIKKLIDSSEGQDLYELIVCDGTKEKFNHNDYYELAAKCLYLYYKNDNDLQKLCSNKLPFDIKKNLTYKEFCQSISKYKNYKIKEYEDNYFSLLIMNTIHNVLNHSLFGWNYVYSSKIEGKENKTHIGKIYLSVRNGDLYKFANMFLCKCLELQINDYKFKINADRYNRRDNLVIYFNENNFKKYIIAIEEVIKENPKLKFGEQSLFAYHYNEHISVAKDFANNQVSFNQVISRVIEECKKSGCSLEQTIKILEKYINKELSDIILLCEKTKESLSKSKQK